MDHWIDRHLRRLRYGQLLRLAADWTAGFLLLFGSAVLAVKLLLPAFWPGVLWIGMGWVPALLIAWWLSKRDAFSRVQSVALLDRKLQAGGLLMALSEAPDPAWTRGLPEFDDVWRQSLPKIRPVRFARTVALPLLFAAGACLMPLRETRSEPMPSTSAGRDTAEQLQDMLQLMKEANVLDAEETAELAEQVARLAEETAAEPLSHEKWETVDALRDRMAIRWEAADRNIAQGRQAAAALAEALRSEGEQLSRERVETLEAAVQEALHRLSQTGALSQLASSDFDQIRKLISNGMLRLAADSEQRQQQFLELQDFLEQASQRLAECRQQCRTQIGPDGGGTQLETTWLEGVRSHRRDDQSAAREGGRRNSWQRGGVSRGPGTAEMTWGDESDANASRFKEVVLPPGFLDKPQNEIVAVSASQPDQQAAGAAPRNPLRDARISSGNETWRRQLRPRHQSVVSQYFDQDR